VAEAQCEGENKESNYLEHSAKMGKVERRKTSGPVREEDECTPADEKMEARASKNEQGDSVRTGGAHRGAKK